MNREFSDAEVMALVAQCLKDHTHKAARSGLRDEDASECRKRIIELIALPRPKSITRFMPGSGIVPPAARNA
jgi:hypothetical protein